MHRDDVAKIVEEVSALGSEALARGDRDLAENYHSVALLWRRLPHLCVGTVSFQRANGERVRVLDRGHLVRRASGLPSGVQTRAKAKGRPGATMAGDLADLRDALRAAVDEHYEPRRSQPAEQRVYLGRDENGRERWGTVELDDNAFDDLDFSVIED